MSDPILFDHDPTTGVTEYFHVLEDGKEWAIETRQDLSGLVEVAKSVANDRTGGWGELTHIAWLPPVIQMRLMQKGILGKGGQILDDVAYRKWLNDPDNRAFRTKLGRV